MALRLREDEDFLAAQSDFFGFARGADAESHAESSSAAALSGF